MIFSSSRQLPEYVLGLDKTLPECLGDGVFPFGEIGSMRFYVNIKRDDYEKFPMLFDYYQNGGTMSDALWEYAFDLQVNMERRDIIVRELDVSVSPGMTPYLDAEGCYARCYGIKLTELKKPLDRYRLAMVITWNSILHGGYLDRGLYGGSGESQDATIACMFHSVYFARPAIPDWATCPEEKLLNIWSALKSGINNDYVLLRNLRFDASIYDRYLSHDFRRFLHSARQHYNKIKRGGEAREYIEPVREFLPGQENSYPARLPPEKIVPLPESISFIKLNTASNSGIPAISAKDESGIPVCLVPSTRRAWAGLLKIYGTPQRDELFPESFENKVLLNPQSENFPIFFQDKFDAAYAGLSDIAEWLGREPTNDPDFTFHVFYLSEVM